VDSAPESPSVPSGEAERRVLPAERLGAAIEVLLCSGFPTQLLLIGIMNGLGMRIFTADGGLSPAYVFTLSLLDTALVLGLVFFFVHAHRERPRDVFLGSRPVVREALLGILLMPVVLVLVAILLAIILTFAPQLHDVPRNPLEDMLQTRTDAIVFAVVVMIAGGVREEVQRGFILRRFQQYLGGGVLGVVLFSTLFGVGHLDQGTDAALATAILGAIWGVVYLLRRSIVAPMVSHAGFNLAQIIKVGALG
jgi:membrane protease YdiL (CAAX protease family)